MVSNVTHFRPTDPAEAVEFDAFMRMLPQLRATHGSEYVAVCGGEVIAVASCQLTAEVLAKRAANGRTYYLNWVEPPEGYVFHIGGFDVRWETETP